MARVVKKVRTLLWEAFSRRSENCRQLGTAQDMVELERMQREQHR